MILSALYTLLLTLLRKRTWTRMIYLHTGAWSLLYKCNLCHNNSRRTLLNHGEHNRLDYQSKMVDVLLIQYISVRYYGTGPVTQELVHFHVIWWFLDKSNCGKSIGTGVYFKSSPWRYYLRGITNTIVTRPEVTYIFYHSMSTALDWLSEQMILHPTYIAGFSGLFVTRDINFVKRKTGCILPENITYGKFKLSFGEAYRPGIWVSTGTRILLICFVASVETPSSTRCNLGQWQPPIDTLKCKRPG